MPHIDASLSALRSYLPQEPEEALRNEAESLLKACEKGDLAAIAEVQDRFMGHLAFGTAGLRAKMESGFRRLNRVTVAKAAYAIGSSLEGHRPVVVGYDGRLNSELFASEIVSVLLGLGFRVHRFDAPIATPICAYAVTHLGASAAIMVTASHNPPSDNGLKVYGSNGAQIVSPVDRMIETRLRDAPDYQDLPRDLKNSENLISDDLFHAYLKSVEQFRISPGQKRERIRVVYTPLHGVGYRFIKEALVQCDFVELLPVEAQKEPDGHFPTLSFPNPEEDGALDLACELAVRKNAEIIIANDPDADRLAVAIPDENGVFKMLSGNDLGAILGCDVLENLIVTKPKLVISTLVSSRLLSVMAKAAGASYAESLTGFSRIAEIGFDQETRLGEQFVFGFEEALGFCVGNFVRDKDGIASALRLLERVALLKAQGKSLWDELDRIALKYGLFRNLQWSFRFSGPLASTRMRSMMSELRALDSKFIGGEHISARHDLLNEDYEGFARGNVLVFFLGDGTRVVVRPSGTESKIKFYTEKFASDLKSEELKVTRQCLDQDLEQLRLGVVEALEPIE